MADKNTINRRAGPGTHRISTVEVYDLTPGSDTDITITLTNRRSVTQPEENSEAKALKRQAKRSPWSSDRLSNAYADRSLRTKELKDPIAELKLFTDKMTRR